MVAGLRAVPGLHRESVTKRSRAMIRGMKFGSVAMLLALLFTWTTSYARDVPLSIKWSGTFADSPIDVIVDDEAGLSANVIEARASGSFGAKVVSVLTEFTPGAFLCDEDGNGLPDEGVLPLIMAYSKPVITFANGDQLWGSVTQGSACLSVLTGYFTGEAQGVYTGGTGRFKDASGSFVVPFWGKNLTIAELGVGYGAIQGEVKGRLER